MTKSNRKGGILLLWLLLAVSTVFAQTITASLQGSVQDAGGASVVGATVTARNAATNVSQTATTGDDGNYLFPALQAGTYEITVEAPNFKTVRRDGVTLTVNQQASLPLVLEVGQVTEVINVTSEAPLLDSTQAGLGQVVDNTKIVNLPLNQRNAYALVLLAPGVTGGVGFQFNEVGFSINGGRQGSNDVLVDGIPSAPSLVNPIQGLSVFPSVDAVQEFKVETNNYSAEFGRSGGGIVNLVYKSGTNDLHGSVYNFLRNSALDANNFFSNRNGIPLGSFKRNQFGASVGGPVVLPRFGEGGPKFLSGRDRTFFFFSYEGLRARNAANILTTVPTLLQRQGDFSQTRAANGQIITIYNPFSTRSVNNVFVRDAFAGNRIPLNLQDPVARRIMEYYPLPNVAGNPVTGQNNFAAQGTGIVNSDGYDVKIDHNFSQNQRAFARFSRRTFTNEGASVFPEQLRVAEGVLLQPQISTGAAIDYNWNITPTYLLNVRVGLGRILLDFGAQGEGFNPTQLGFPAYIANNADRLVFPGIAPAGFRALGVGGPDIRRNAFMTHSLQIANTKIAGRHTLKFGLDARLFRVNNLEAGAATGNFNFGPNFTQGPNANVASATSGNGLASFLLGLGGGIFTTKFRDLATQSFYYGPYIQDDWRVTDRLSLNMGLRWEIETPRTERYDRMNYFDPTIRNPLSDRTGLNLQGGLVYVGVGGAERRQFKTDLKNFGPRLGFAYQITPQTVVRAAGGIFYGAHPYSAGGVIGALGFRTDTPFLGTIDTVTPNFRLSDPFPNGFLPASGSSLGASSFTGTVVNGPLPDQNATRTYSWNGSIQRQFFGILAEAAYVGTRAIDLTEGADNYNLNQLRPEQLALGTALADRVPNPFFGLINVAPYNLPTIPRRNLIAPYPQYSVVNPLFKTDATSSFHSLQLRAERRLSNGVTFQLSYTKQKLIDTYSNIAQVGRAVAIQNIYDRGAEKAVSPNDVSQRLVASFVAQVPFGRGKRFGNGLPGVVDAVLGNWQMNGIYTWQTGLPLLITTTNTSQSGSNTLRPNNNGRSALIEGGDPQTRLDRWFNTSVFSQPAPFTFGNTGRTLPDVRGPNSVNMDFSLFKNFPIRERVNVQFRAEAFNVTNTPVFGLPDQALNSQTFGQINTQANSPRQIQFALKLLF